MRLHSKRCSAGNRQETPEADLSACKCLSADRLFENVSGAKLSPSELRHLEQCEKCTREKETIAAMYRAMAAAFQEVNTEAATLHAEDVATAVMSRIEEQQRAAAKSVTGWLMSPVPAWVVVVLLLMFPVAWAVWRSPSLELGVEKGAPAVVPGPINRGLRVPLAHPPYGAVGPPETVPALTNQPGGEATPATSGLDALQLFEMLYGADAQETGELVAVGRLLEAYLKKHPEDPSVRVKLVAVYTRLTQRSDLEGYGLTRAEVEKKLQAHRHAVEKQIKGMLHP